MYQFINTIARIHKLVVLNFYTVGSVHNSVTVADHCVGMWLLRQLLLVLSLAAVIQVGVGAQTLDLHSTLPSDNHTCPGEKVIFTCVVQGPVLAWSSEEYIGSGGTRLEFGTVDKLMTNKTAANRSSTIATLLSINESGGVTKMESQLEILVSAAYPISSVVCHDVSAGTLQSVDFKVTRE